MDVALAVPEPVWVIRSPTQSYKQSPRPESNAGTMQSGSGGEASSLAVTLQWHVDEFCGSLVVNMAPRGPLLPVPWPRVFLSLTTHTQRVAADAGPLRCMRPPPPPQKKEQSRELAQACLCCAVYVVIDVHCLFHVGTASKHALAPCCRWLCKHA